MIALLLWGCTEAGDVESVDTAEREGPAWTYRQPEVVDLGDVLRIEWSTDVCVDGVCIAERAEVWWGAGGLPATLEADGRVWHEIERCEANGRPEGDGTATLLVVVGVYGEADSVVASAAPARVPWECP